VQVALHAEPMCRLGGRYPTLASRSDLGSATNLGKAWLD
jgi:hypothetical protein